MWKFQFEYFSTITILLLQLNHIQRANSQEFLKGLNYGTQTPLLYNIKENTRFPYVIGNLAEDLAKSMRYPQRISDSLKFQLVGENKFANFFTIAGNGIVSIAEGANIDREDTTLCPIQHLECQVKIPVVVEISNCSSNEANLCEREFPKIITV